MANKCRAVQVVSITQDYLRELPQEEMVSETFDRMEAAAAFGPDIVCLPELFTDAEPEPVPGPTTERVAQWAKAKGAYVICPIATKAERGKYNSAVLIDRSGGIVGQYHKMNPTEGELEKGTVPGPGATAFKTDFGTIGIQICFDVNWRQVWAGLKQQGADIIF